MYDQAEECELKVNDVVEIFGVFELDLEPEGVVPPGADNIQAMVAEERALRPPPSAQPRLHCILHRKMPAQHHPLLPPPDTREEQLVMASARAQLGALRPVVLAAFTSALGGDALGAECAATLPPTRPSPNPHPPLPAPCPACAGTRCSAVCRASSAAMARPR